MADWDYLVVRETTDGQYKNTYVKAEDLHAAVAEAKYLSPSGMQGVHVYNRAVIKMKENEWSRS